MGAALLPDAVDPADEQQDQDQGDREPHDWPGGEDADVHADDDEPGEGARLGTAVDVALDLGLDGVVDDYERDRSCDAERELQRHLQAPQVDVEQHKWFSVRRFLKGVLR